METLYNAHPQTKEYLKGNDTKARQNHMWKPETHAPEDRWLYNPQTSSLKAPPETGDHEVAVLESCEWVLKPDYRKTVYYDTSTQVKHVIKEIGTRPDPDWTNQKPLPHSKWNGTAWQVDLTLWLEEVVRPQRDAKLSSCDYLIMPDYPLDESKKVEWKAYRQALRDLPGQFTKVTEPVSWPAAPAP